jgi:hypothetical protein
MNEPLIYGVDTNKEVTAPIARDAIVTCFTDAHKNSLELEDPNDESAQLMIRTAVIEAFKKTGGDFEHPTKESLLAAAENLRSFSKSFRNQETIESHFSAIKKLIDAIQ